MSMKGQEFQEPFTMVHHLAMHLKALVWNRQRPLPAAAVFPYAVLQRSVTQPQTHRLPAAVDWRVKCTDHDDKQQ